MVRYFLTDLRGNPIYSFAQRLRRNNNNQQQQQQLLLRNSRLFAHHSAQQQSHPHSDAAVRIEEEDDDRVDVNEENKKMTSSKSSLPPQDHQQQQLYHVKNFSSMTLVCYIRNQQWEDVQKRISQVQYYHEVYMVDTTTGNTILHTVCRYNPPSYIVQALCNPYTVRAANYDGTTPLHIAASHRCSKDALQTLFDCCRLYYNQQQLQQHRQYVCCGDDEEEDEEEGNHLQQLQHTSPTADLSRIGRAPIHYACMSFRGLDIEAFKLLLNETLQYGNIWVYEHTTNTTTTTGVSAAAGTQRYDMNHIHDVDEYDMDDMDLEFNDSSIGGGKKGVMEVVNEHEVYGQHEDIEYEESRDDQLHPHHRHQHDVLYEFENETDQSLYQQYGVSTETAGWKSSCSSVDNDALTNNINSNSNKILVNVMGMKDATGQTPIGLLFRRYRERVRCVINTVDKIRSTTTTATTASNVALTDNSNNNNKAALVAAIQVHADLGELWERARWIISRLTEERLLREQHEKSSTAMNQDDSFDVDNNNSTEDSTTLYQYHQDGVVYPNIQQRDATSRRTNDYGGSTKVVVPSFLSKPGRRPTGHKENNIDGTVLHQYCNNHHSEPPSPVAQEAASWACELHPPNRSFDPMMTMLPFAPDISTTTTANVASPKSLAVNNNNLHPVHAPKNNNHFRIVHASVGLTGYGCPPELIRLAISIHPNQVMEMDTDGNLPIHIAVTAASYLAYTNPIDSNTTNNTSTTAAAVSYMANHFSNNSNYSSHNSVGGDDHSSVMSDAALSFFSTATVSQTTNPFDQVIKILLQHYPDSARVPQGKSGRLPLVLAIEESKIGRRRTWNDGIRTLLHAYPPALHNKKIIEPILYPHVLSLVANNGTTQQQQQQPSHTHPDGTSSYAFDFSDYVDVVPNHRHPMSSSNSILKKRQPPPKETKKKSQRTIRQELCCRTTLYELLRSKPDWLTLGVSSQIQNNKSTNII